MAKREPETSKGQDVERERISLASQGWFSLAIFMAFGLLFEGLIGYRSPAYLNDSMRRELFRLAHAHGTILSLVLLIADQYLTSRGIAMPRPPMLSLRIGAVIMPLGFLLGGIWHTETDPDFLVILSPIGGVMLIFGIVAIALASVQKPAPK